MALFIGRRAELSAARLAVVAAMLALRAASAVSATVDASFGWRFATGLPLRDCSVTQFPPSGLDGQQVFGLSQASSCAEASAAACMGAACSAGVPLFQWCPGGAACGAQSCWIGQYTGTSAAQAGWASGLANTSIFTAIPVPAAAAPSYNDSAWALVDRPQDYGINGTFCSSSTCDPGESFLPYRAAFYRKRFSLPPAFSARTWSCPSRARW
jgi:hypothetical protein